MSPKRLFGWFLGTLISAGTFSVRTFAEEGETEVRPKLQLKIGENATFELRSIIRAQEDRFFQTGPDEYFALGDIRLDYTLFVEAPPNLAWSYSPVEYGVRRVLTQGESLEAEEAIQIHLIFPKEDDPLYSDATTAEGIFDVYPPPVLKDPAVEWFLGWWSDSRKQWVGELSMAASFPNVVSGSVRIPAEAIAGRPVLMAWKDGTFIPPTPFAPQHAGTIFAALQNGGSPLVEDQLTSLVDARDMKFRTAAMHAASWGLTDWLRILAKVSSEEEGGRLLRIAATHGHANAVKILLETGFDPNAEDAIGFDAGHLAVQGGHISIVELLLESEIYDAKSRTNLTFFSPLSLALRNGFDRIFHLLRSHGLQDAGEVREELEGLISKNARMGNARILEYLLTKAKRARVNVSRNREMLLEAIRGGNPECVSLLLEAGIDADPRRGASPLQLASQLGRTEIVRLLLDAAADPNRKGEREVPPLATAARGGNAEIVRLLLEQGAQPDLTVQDGDDAYGLVELATLLGEAQIVGDLFASGATCQLPPERAETVLVAAMQHDIVETAKLAAEACLDPGFRFYDRFSVGWVADYYQSSQILAWLKEAGWSDWSEPERFLSPSKIETPPKALHLPVPYPAEIWQRYGSSRISLRALIDHAGAVYFPLFQGEIPPTEIRQLILAAIPQWKFEPATANGEAVATVAQFRVDLELSTGEAEVSLNQVTKAPKPISQKVPRYPEGLKSKAFKGFVRLSFIVERDSSVSNMEVLFSSHPLLEYAAVQAVSEWRFEPAKVNDELVRCVVRITIPFQSN